MPFKPRQALRQRWTVQGWITAEHPTCGLLNGRMSPSMRSALVGSRSGGGTGTPPRVPATAPLRPHHGHMASVPHPTCTHLSACRARPKTARPPALCLQSPHATDPMRDFRSGSEAGAGSVSIRWRRSRDGAVGSDARRLGSGP